MSQFLKVNELGYHIEGGYIAESVDRYEMHISATYSATTEPECKRKLIQFVLSKSELNELIKGLEAIKYSHRKSDTQYAG